MLPQPLAHRYSLLTAQLRTGIQHYSNGFCDSGIERIREAVGREGSQSLYKMDRHRFTSRTYVMCRAQANWCKSTETAPRGYLQEQVAAN